jgi:hypothetical protein
MVQNEVNILVKDDIEENKIHTILPQKYKSIFSSWHTIKKNGLRNILTGFSFGFISGFYYSEIILGIQVGVCISIIYTLIR